MGRLSKGEHLLASHSSEHRTPVVCFALFYFFFFFLSFFVIFRHFSSFIFLMFLFFLWPDLFCCVLVPDTLVFHLLYLDELRLFGLLCLTVVCDNRICTRYLSINMMKNQHGHWVYSSCCWVEIIVECEDDTQSTVFPCMACS